MWSTESTKHGGFSYIIFLLRMLTVVDCSQRNPRDVFVEQGQNIVLKCANQSFHTTWDGPNILKQPNDVNNITRYIINENVNTQLQNVDKISVVGNFTVGEYNLKIDNISTNEEGIYTSLVLTTTITTKECYFLLRIKVLPRNLVIWNTTEDGFVVGSENVPLNLICSVKSGVPPESITWYQNAEPKIRGGPGKLPYFFSPKRTDNGNIYSCTAQNPDLKLPLKQSVKLNITYSPSIAFDSDDKTIQIREGDNLKVRCISDGNPIPFLLTWTRIKTAISTKNNSNVAWLVIRNISRQFTDKYTCEAKNIIGRGIGSKYLQVLYPPSVTVTYHTSSRQVMCLSHGDPDKYVIYNWEHKSEFGKHIRYLGNSSNISVLGHVPRFNWYRLAGWYICSVSNGIADQRGYVIQKGKSFVKLTGKPVFVTENINIQYARFGKDGVVCVLVYSFPKYNNISITSMGEHHVLKYRQFHVRERVIKDTLNNVNIKLSGYEISLQKYSLDVNDFTKYIFQVTNTMGSHTYTVELVSADKPEAPLNLTVLPQTTFIIVSWTKNFNGGFKQRFWIEYKEDKFLEWSKEGPIYCSKQNTYSHILNAVKPNTRYTIRVFSENEVGKSNNSNTFTVKTPEDERKMDTWIFVPIGAGVVLLFVLSNVCNWYMQKRTRTQMQPVNNSSTDNLEDNNGIQYGPYDEIDFQTDSDSYLHHSENSPIQYGPYDEIDIQTATYLEVVNSNSTTSLNGLPESEGIIPREASGASLSLNSFTNSESSYDCAVSRQDSTGYLNPYNALHHDSQTRHQNKYKSIRRLDNLTQDHSAGNIGVQNGPSDEIEFQTGTYLDVVNSYLTTAINCLVETEQVNSHNVWEHSPTNIESSHECVISRNDKDSYLNPCYVLQDDTENKHHATYKTIKRSSSTFLKEVDS